MEVEDFQNICLSLPGVTEDLKWDHNLCFCVKEKIFCMVDLDVYPHSFGIKVSAEEFESLIERDGIKQAPYMAKNSWIKIDTKSQFDRSELKSLILASYQLIKSKLPKRVQKELENE